MNANLKIYCKFENSLAFEEINATTGTFVGVPSIVPSHDGNGWRMSPLVKLSLINNQFPTGISGSFSVGFWIKSVNPGRATNGTTLSSLKLPVVAKSGFSNFYTPSSPQFSIFEQTQADGTNILSCYLQGASSNNTISSTSYSVGVFHHHVVVYNGTTLVFYRDGVAAGTGTVGFSTLASTTQPLQINAGTYSLNNYDVVGNSGVIDELFVATDAMSSDNAARIYSLGVPYVYNPSLVNIQEDAHTITFDDLNTTVVRAVVSDDSDIYVGRSDGVFLRGRRTIWKTSVSFEGPGEVALLAAQYGPQTSSAGYSIARGVLSTTSAVIRI